MGAAAVAPGDRIRVLGSRVGQAQSGACGVRQAAGTDRCAAAGGDGLGVHAHRGSRRSGDPRRRVGRGREHSADRHDDRGDVHGPSALRLQRHQYHRVSSRRTAVRPARLRGQSSLRCRPVRADPDRRRSLLDRQAAGTKKTSAGRDGEERKEQAMNSLIKTLDRSRLIGGPDVLEIREIPEPEPKECQAVIQVKGLGHNHAEMHMRKGEWAEIADVSGIECVGVVKACPGGEFAVGTNVAALMGGLGRTINGSYAEYTRAPVTSVATIESDLSWAELAAIPETYATAWTCLFRNLEIAKGQTLVIRGASSSFGQAAVNMAVNA